MTRGRNYLQDRMGNWRGCLPAAKHHHHHHLILLRSVVLPHRHHHNRWEEKRKLQYRRCGRTIVAGLFGNGRAPLSDLDHLHAAAARAASIRFRESHRPDPLLIDLYAGCLLSTGVAGQDGIKEQHSLSMASSSPCHYTLATKFIDDKLLNLAIGADDVKQIVLLTDGFDTRPYRLKWPLRTVIFDISPESVFKVAHRSLESAGAEITKTCKYIHIPLESYDLRASLCKEGFDGGRPSLWAVQGLPVMTSADFGEILSTISSLATKGCAFVGELPGCLFDTEIGNKISLKRWINKMFTGNGFRVEVIDYNDVAKIVRRSSPQGDSNSILFVAEQLKFSDKQLENWRMEYLRMEEEGNEEGFEDLP